MKYGAVSIDPQIMKGAPVINDTHVPVQAFFEYLEAGKSLDSFLSDYPDVNKKEVIEILQMAKVIITDEKILRDNFLGQ